LAQQQDPKSPKYHQWITPEQWADRYGLSQNDVAKISAWLKLQGFAVGNVARGRNWITFSGTAAQVEAAFGTEIHRYKVDGEMHIANAHAPKVPALLAGIVTGIRGLNDFRVRPNVVHRDFAARPYYSSSSVGDVVAPGDIATIYDIHALYNASTPIDGTGQRLAVIGQTDIYLSDLVNFRTGFGLSSISCTTTTSGVISACNDPHLKYVFVNDTTTTDPLVPVPGDLSEADLDLEMSGATARNAQLVYVNAPFVSNGTTFTGGVWDAWYWAVDKNLAPVISMSYGLCEFFDNSIIDPNTGLPAPDEIELMKANSLGITFVNSTGDFGAAECDSNSTLTQAGLATQGVGVGYPASSPEVTGVGGTAIPLTNLGSGANAGTYWGTTNGTDGGSVLSVPGYIPEQAWNDDDEIGAFCAQNPSNSFCSSNGVTDALSAQSAIGVSSTGGGASNCATQDPTFSTCLAGFPQPTWQAVSIAGQSSARFSPDVSLLATPNFPGYIFCTELSELGVAGSGSSCAPGGATGIVNALALSSPSIIGGTSASAPVFAGIVTLMNQYLNGSSAAGLGNINPTLYALAQTTSNAAFHPVTSSSNQVYCVGNTPSGMASTLQCPITGLLGFLGSSADTTTSYNLVTGLGSIDANKLAIAWKQFSTHASFKLSPNTTVLTAVAGAATNSTTITITPQNGFTGTVTFACSNPPSGTTCNFTPTTSASSTSLSIQTTSGMSNLQNASIIVTGTSGAVSSSATVSLAVTGGTESFSLQSNLGSGGTLALVAGASGVVNLGVSSTDGFVTTTGGSSQTALPVTYACTGLPSASQCTFTPAAATQSVSVTLNVATTAPTASLRRNGDRNGIFYAALLPGLLGIVFTFTSRKRALRRLHLLTLVVALGFSTMWMASCGGGSSGSHGSPGTPKGSYPITVNATTSGGPSSSTSFTLQVN
jgi:subtilase family serine protease